MTPSQVGTSELSFGGVLLRDLVAPQEGQLVERVMTGLVAELATYADLPAEALSDDIAQAVRRGLRLFLATLATGELPDRDALAEVSESAARRAEEQIPLSAVLAAYQTGARLVLTELAVHAGPGDTQHVVRAATLALDFLNAVHQVVAARYLEERRAITDVDADHSAQRLRRLLDGEVDDAAGAHLVVRLAVGEHPDERADGLGGEVAARRKVRRLRAAVTLAGDEVLGQVHPGGGLLVIPAGDGGTERAWQALPGLVASLRRAAGAPLHAAGVTAADPSRVPGAVDVAGEVLDLVLRSGRPEGIHRLEDVAVEYQLTRPGPARALLAGTVRPLLERPDLLATLDAYLRAGQDRRAAAAALHVHPNTVDYRLARVADLVGSDPTARSGAVPLRAALVALAAEDGLVRTGGDGPDGNVRPLP